MTVGYASAIMLGGLADYFLTLSFAPLLIHLVLGTVLYIPGWNAWREGGSLDFLCLLLAFVATGVLAYRLWTTWTTVPAILAGVGVTALLGMIYCLSGQKTG